MRLTIPLHEPQADDGAGELEQSQMGTELPLEADAQLAEPSEPGMRAFDHPAVTPEPLAALDTTSCDATLNASLAQSSAALLIVVALVRMHLVGPFARPTWQTANGLHRVDEVLEEHRVVPVGPAHQDRQRQPSRIGQDMALAAELAPVGRIGACVLPPRGLATLAPSMLARDQSIWSY